LADRKEPDKLSGRTWLYLFNACARIDTFYDWPVGPTFFQRPVISDLQYAGGGIALYFGSPVFSFNGFLAIWIGIPSGIVTALIFMILNYYVLQKQNKLRLVKQLISYFIILTIVAVSFLYGGDWIFEINNYFSGPR